ncbi:MAG TPA: UDP-glucuronic acid decarboxylase family protein [Acidimicrobiia bacterium]|nr:UDP-glucuronic acid decarboxylase family protein [Acidimicrobiia bacterium]
MTRAVVTGGAGFIGSHVCDALVARGWDVVAVDNFLTGRRENVADAERAAGFTLVEQDVSRALDVDGRVDAVLHLASPASPPEYLRYPIETLDVGSAGTRNALDLAERTGARFLLASTSEVYGDPEQHPQPETYWGNVNPIGPRSVYDESKRFAEALTFAYHRTYDVDVAVVRIFNTYGPRLRPSDGRVVSNLLVQAMEGRPLTVYGDGSQTRSFCYVDDEVRGILALLDSEHAGPVNIGNTTECSMLELARTVLDVTGSRSEIVFEPLPADDPARRRPDITRARDLLGWEPKVELADGLARTYEWYRQERDRG